MPLDAAALKRLPGVQWQQPAPLPGRTAGHFQMYLYPAWVQRLSGLVFPDLLKGYPQMIPQPIPQQAVLGQPIPAAYAPSPMHFDCSMSFLGRLVVQASWSRSPPVVMPSIPGQTQQPMPQVSGAGQLLSSFCWLLRKFGFSRPAGRAFLLVSLRMVAAASGRLCSEGFLYNCMAPETSSGSALSFMQPCYNP